MRLLATLVLLLLPLGCERPPTLDGLAYPGARLLVERQVTGRAMEFHWRCLAPRDPLERVVAHYDADRGLARAAFKLAPGEVGFADRRDPELHVAVFPAANLALHRQCEASLSPEEVTMLQVTLGRPAPAGS